MTSTPLHAEQVETFRGSADGAFGVTLRDGHIDHLRIPSSAMNPADADELGHTLVHLLNAALDDHTAALLQQTTARPSRLDPEAAAVDHFAALALAEAEGVVSVAPSHRRGVRDALTRPLSPTVTGRSPGGDVVAALVLGQLQRVEVSEHMLASARPATVADAIVAAVTDALDRNAVDQDHHIHSLRPEQVSQETKSLHSGIITLQEERS